MTENEAIKVLVTQKQCIDKSSSGQCKIHCGDCKKKLTAKINEFLDPIRARRAEYEAHPATLDDIIEEGNKAAHEVACETMAMVRDAIKI